MIIFFEGGRLGNQLFQYSGLRKICLSDRLYIYGMHSLKKNFLDIKTIKSNVLFDYLMRRVGQKRLSFLSNKLRIIGFIEKKLVDGEIQYTRHPGIIKSIYFCPTVYFQSEKLIDKKTASELKLKPSILEKSQNIISYKPSHFSDCFFVHIRRGDYATFPSKELSAMLPKEWYCKQMDAVRARYSNPFFIIVTDDVIYAKDQFQNQADVFISCEQEEVDLGIMSLCKGGILSASSFSWWGAYLSRKNNPNSLYIAPKFWLGYQSREWIPSHIETNWISYVDAP